MGCLRRQNEAKQSNINNKQSTINKKHYNNIIYIIKKQTIKHYNNINKKQYSKEIEKKINFFSQVKTYIHFRCII